MRSPAKHRTIILRLKTSTTASLAAVAAKENRDLEEVLEDLIEATYSPDRKTKVEREAALSRPIPTDPAVEREVVRLSKLGNDYQRSSR